MAALKRCLVRWFLKMARIPCGRLRKQGLQAKETA